MYSNKRKAIEVRNLSKMYKLPSHNPRWWQFSNGEPFWALRGVSLKIKPGEIVGIIGRNGSGKSTLLKVLTRITPPTSGEADLYGRVGSLLEVGTGFHPELTGRENIYLNGAILGMRRKEITAEFDAIVAFAGVEKFLEMPVKRYSSGMYVRLAFAVAAHLRSEILLVDEVLAVGDIEFQKHCLGKIRDVAMSGRTVVFVSHQIESVSALCKRAIVLDSGKVIFDGCVPEAVESYMTSFKRHTAALQSFDRRPGSGEIRLVEVEAIKSFFEPNEPKRIRLLLKRQKPTPGPVFISVGIVDPMGTLVIQCDSRLTADKFLISDSLELELVVNAPWLKPGCYRVDIYICGSALVDKCDQACYFDVAPVLPYPMIAPSDATDKGVVFADFDFNRKSDAVLGSVL